MRALGNVEHTTPILFQIEHIDRQVKKRAQIQVQANSEW